MAVRVRLPQWIATYRMFVNDEIIDPQTLAKILDRAGIAEGIGTWRPRHGRFRVTQLEELDLADADYGSKKVRAALEVA